MLAIGIGFIQYASRIPPARFALGVVSKVVWGPLGGLWVSFWVPWRSFGQHFGTLLGAFGGIWAPFWSLLGALGGIWAPSFLKDTSAFPPLPFFGALVAKMVQKWIPKWSQNCTQIDQKNDRKKEATKDQNKNAPKTNRTPSKAKNHPKS